MSKEDKMKVIYDHYTTGCHSSDITSDTINEYYTSLNDSDREYLVKKIKQKQSFDQIVIDAKEMPIHSTRVSLVSTKKQTVQAEDINIMTIPFADPGKYFLTEKQIRENVKNQQQQYYNELLLQQSSCPLSATIEDRCEYSVAANELKPKISFDEIAHDAKDTRHEGNHMQELVNNLTLPQKYRKTISNMKCYS